MAFQHDVLAMMVSNLWFLIGSEAPDVDGVGGDIGGIGEVGTPPELFGVPEHVPEKTFIVRDRPDATNDFIPSANAYHRTYGLDPRTINSLEHLVELLAAESAHINRLRIVGHVGLDEDTDDANLNIPFFRGGLDVVPQDALTGFGASDEAGLRSLFGTASYLTPTGPLMPDRTSEILAGLRLTNRAVLTPFGLATGSSHSGDTSLFLWACCDLQFCSLAADADFAVITENGTRITATQRGYASTAIGKLADAAQARLEAAGTYTAVQMNDLKAAILGLSFFRLDGRFPIFPDFASDILSAIRSTNATLLAPLGLEASGSPSGDAESFFFACSDLLFANLVLGNASLGGIQLGGSSLSATQRTDLLATLEASVTHFSAIVAASSPGISDADMTGLRSAIMGLTEVELGYTALGDADFTHTSTAPFTHRGTFDRWRLLHEATQAMERSFRADLTAAKARLDATSWVDIRGCRIGRDEPYLEAFRSFLGRAGDLPSISGPQWFQNFSSPGGRTTWPATETHVDDIWARGNPALTHTALQIQDMLRIAGNHAGTPTHMEFWRNVSDLAQFEFAALVWRGSLPDLPIEVPRLADFNTLSFTDAIGRIGQIFNVDITEPLAAAVSRIQGVHDHVFALQSEIETIADMGTPPVATELSESFSRLQEISSRLELSIVPGTAPSPLELSHLDTYTGQLKKHVEIVTLAGASADLFTAWLAVEELAGSSSPPASELSAQFTALRGVQSTVGASGIVPDTEPADLDAATLVGYASDLFDHVMNGSVLHDFIAAVNTKVNHNVGTDDLAEFRYYLFVGLALLLDHPSQYYFYTLSSVRDAAIRSFMKAHWQGVLPTPNGIAGAMLGQPAARQCAILSEDRARTVMVFNPYVHYNDQIVKVHAV